MWPVHGSMITCICSSFSTALLDQVLSANPTCAYCPQKCNDHVCDILFKLLICFVFLPSCSSGMPASTPAAGASLVIHPLRPTLRITADAAAPGDGDDQAKDITEALGQQQQQHQTATPAEPADCWWVLADLYQQLAAPDLVGLVRTAHLVRCPGG